MGIKTGSIPAHLIYKPSKAVVKLSNPITGAITYYSSSSVVWKNLNSALVVGTSVHTQMGKVIQKVKESEKPKMAKKKKKFTNGTLSEEHPLRKLFAIIYLAKFPDTWGDEFYCGCDDYDDDDEERSSYARETLEELNFDVVASLNWLKQRGAYCDCETRYQLQTFWKWDDINA